MNCYNMRFASPTLFAIRRQDQNAHYQYVLIDMEKRKTGSWSIDATHFDFSKNGSRLCVAYPSSLLVYDVSNAALILNIPVSETSKVSCIKCIDNDHYAAVVDRSLFLIDCTSEDHYREVASIDASLLPEDVVDIQMNLAFHYYLLRFDDSDVGSVQFGPFSEKASVCKGMAGCLCSLDTCFVKMDIIVLFRRSVTDPNLFLLCSSSLIDGDTLHFHKGRYRFDHCSKENRPDHCFVDSATGTMFIVTHDGMILVWDLFHGYFLQSFRFAKCSLVCGEGIKDGVIGVWRNKPKVQKLTWNREQCIQEVLHSEERNAFALVSLLIRMGTIDHDDLLTRFVSSCVMRNRELLSSCLSVILSEYVVEDMDAIVSRLSSTKMTERFFSQLLELWERKELVLWQSRLCDMLKECIAWRCATCLPEDKVSVSQTIKESETLCSPSLAFASRLRSIERVMRLLPGSQSKEDAKKQLCSLLFEDEAQRALASSSLSL